MSAIIGKTYARPFSAPIGKPLAPAKAPPTPPAASKDGWQPAAATSSVRAARPPVAVQKAAPVGPSSPTVADADLRLDVFNSDKDLKPFFTGSSYGDPNAVDAPFAQRVSQRMVIAKGNPALGPDGAIFTETKAVVKATPEKILAQLRDPHFWNNGSVDHWTPRPDGSFTYALWPAGKMAGVKVNETMHAPQRQADGSYVVRIDLSRKGNGSQLMPGQADGRAYIVVKPRGDGSTEVTGRFAGVKESNPIFNPEQFAKNHLLGERGELKSGDSFINLLLPNGTGFGAMLQRAEKTSP